MANVKDMSTRRLKRYYLRNLRRAWRNAEYRESRLIERNWYARPRNNAEAAAIELKRRGWEVPSA